MDLNRMVVFARVVEEGSFTKAARALHLPKSSVSRSISLLEEDLGTRLLQRSSRKVSTTEAGAIYYAQVAKAAAILEEANATAREERVVPRGTIRMTAPFDAGSDVLVPLLTRFLERYPTIQIDVVLTGRVIDLAAEGFDLALRAGPARDPSLVAQKIADVRFGVFASRAYLKRSTTPSSVAALATHRCVLFHGDRGRARWTLSSKDREESVDVHGAISVDELAAVRSAVLSGAGIGMLPPFACEADVASGQVVRLLPDWLGPESTMSIVHPSARLIPQRVVLLRDYLVEELGHIYRSCVKGT